MLERLPQLDTVVSAYNVQLTPHGAGRKVGLCPFHSEDTPSFVLFLNEFDNQHYHCFGCGQHGSVIDFVMAVEGVDFKAALAILSKQFHVTLTPHQAAIIKKQRDCTEWYTGQIRMLEYLEAAYQWALQQATDPDLVFDLMADLERLVGPKIHHDDPAYLLEAPLRHGGIMGRLIEFGSNPYAVVAKHELRHKQPWLPPIMEAAGTLKLADAVMAAYRAYRRSLVMEDAAKLRSVMADLFFLAGQDEFHRFMQSARRALQGARRNQTATKGHRRSHPGRRNSIGQHHPQPGTGAVGSLVLPA